MPKLTLTITVEGPITLRNVATAIDRVYLALNQWRKFPLASQQHKSADAEKSNLTTTLTSHFECSQDDFNEIFKDARG